MPTTIDDMAFLVGRLQEMLEEEARSIEDSRVCAGALDAHTVDDCARSEEIGIIDCIVMPWMKVLMDAGNDALEVPLSQRLELIEEFAEAIIRPLSRAAAAR